MYDFSDVRKKNWTIKKNNINNLSLSQNNLHRFNKQENNIFFNSSSLKKIKISNDLQI